MSSAKVQSEISKIIPVGANADVTAEKNLKRRAAEPEVEEAPINKKAKVVEHEYLVEEEEEEQEVEEEGGNIPDDVQERLDYIESLVDRLSKQYLKGLMRELPGFWGSCGGTNRDMAAQIVGHLEQSARDGEDLKDDMRIVKRWHRQCWGGCVGDSEDEDEADEAY